MVDVVVAAVDIGQAVDLPSGGAPHLGHVDVGEVGLADGDATDGVPDKALAPECLLDILRHLVDEGGGRPGLVAADVEIGCEGEGGSQLVEQGLEHGFALLAVHGEAHGGLEGLAVAGHVNLGDDDHAALRGVGFQLGALRLGVVAAGKARHGRGGVELGIGFRLEAEALVVSEVPVKDVDLEARQQVHLMLQFVEADKGTAHIVHVAAQLEGGVVGDAHAGDGGAAVGGGELHQGLCGADDAGRCGCSDGDGVGGDLELVALVGEASQGVVEGAEGGGINDVDVHGGSSRSALVGEEGSQQRGAGSVRDAHGLTEVEGGSVLGQLMGLRQEQRGGGLGNDVDTPHQRQEQ